MNVKDPELGWPKVWEAELLLLHPHGCQSLHWLWTPQAPAMDPNPPCSFPGPPQNWHYFSVPQCFGCCMLNGITWDTKIQMWYWERDVVNIVFCCCCCFVCLFVLSFCPKVSETHSCYEFRFYSQGWYEPEEWSPLGVSEPLSPEWEKSSMLLPRTNGCCFKLSFFYVAGFVTLDTCFWLNSPLHLRR